MPLPLAAVPILYAGGAVLLRLGPTWGPRLYQILSNVGRTPAIYNWSGIPRIGGVLSSFGQILPNGIRILFQNWTLTYCDKTNAILVEGVQAKTFMERLPSLLPGLSQLATQARQIPHAELMREAASLGK